MKILVADDSKLARNTLIKTLKENIEYDDIFQATDGEEAIKLVEKEKPSLVFLDLTMPNMDGYSALEKILEIAPEIKVIVVSADVQTSSKQRVLSLGAKMMVPKPISNEKMKNIISQILR